MTYTLIIDLPVESFLLVPIQVLFGNIWTIGKTAIALLLVALAIHLTFWLLQVLGSMLEQKLNLSSLKIRSVKFLRSLLDETVIVAWILIALFLLASQQGFADARRDAIDETSTLPVTRFKLSSIQQLLI